MCLNSLPVAGGERDWNEKNLFLRFLLLRPNGALLEEGRWFPIDCFSTKTAAVVVARYSRCSDDEDSGWTEEVAPEGATL